MKTVILDGTRHGEQHFDFTLALLKEEVYNYYGSQASTFKLREINISPCIGCFNCWLKTPGKCIHRDPGSGILSEILSCNTVIFFTPVVFGGYSSELKKIIDRLLPTVLPFFKEVYGETHHQARYLSIPRLIGVGLQPYFHEREANCFKILVGRNAINFNAPTYAAATISHTDTPENLRTHFKKLFSSSDNIPLTNNIYSLLKKKTPLKNPIKGNRALLIKGSQKIRHPSTSALLGEELLKNLKKQGYKTESLSLEKKICEKKGQEELLFSVSKADTILLSFPLYVDSLPFLVTKALEIIALHWESEKIVHQKNFFVLVNNGLPESYQNIVALDICQNFTLRTGISWVGGLAIGAGEALISGNSLTGLTGFRGLIKRPPLFYMKCYLKTVAKSLAKERPISDTTVRLLDLKPAPLISSGIWRHIFIKAANNVWKKEALRNSLKPNEMLKTPYE